jgi:hypothetical protein
MRRIDLPWILLTLMSATAFQAPDQRPFDGTWDTVLSCANRPGVLGFSYRFPSIVKDSVLHAEHGPKGKPGWLQIDGKIQRDGSASFYADGLVGASDAAVGHVPSGTEYGYHIDAKFVDDEGTGHRVEGRSCDLTFRRIRQDRNNRDARDKSQ